MYLLWEVIVSLAHARKAELFAFKEHTQAYVSIHVLLTFFFIIFLIHINVCIHTSILWHSFIHFWFIYSYSLLFIIYCLWCILGNRLTLYILAYWYLTYVWILYWLSCFAVVIWRGYISSFIYFGMRGVFSEILADKELSWTWKKTVLWML